MTRAEVLELIERLAVEGPDASMSDVRAVCRLLWKAEQRVRDLEDGSLVNARMVWLEGRVRELEARQQVLEEVAAIVRDLMQGKMTPGRFERVILDPLAALAASEA